ncbi:MAG: MFS transporter [Alphaproteobacteria bacterium]
MRKQLTSYIMWFLALSFFAYQFILRLTPGLILTEIRDKFQVDATSFGLLSSMYYFGYAGMQIPIAVLLEKYGPKYVISACVLIASLSNLAFVFTDQWWVALLGRFLIGAGSAVGFLGVSKIISLYFPSKHYGKMIALSFTFGLIGALYGGRPINSLMELLGWQHVLEIVSSLGIVLSILILLFIKSKNDNGMTDINDVSILKQIISIIKNPQIIIIAIANLLMVGALEGFADIWGIIYLTKAYNFTKNDAATVTSSIFFGMIFGGPILSYFADKYNAYAQTLTVSGIIMGLLFISMLQGNNYFSYSNLCVLTFIIGILCCYQVIIFTFCTKIVDAKLQGISIAFLNCINMLGGSFFHTSIGYILDAQTNNTSISMVNKDYSIDQYTNALYIIPLSSIIGGIMFIFLYRRRAKQSVAEKELEYA